jgi:LacI family transcriptional regulator
MRSSRTNVIGLILPDISNPYCHEIMRGVNASIKKHKYELVIYVSGNRHSFELPAQEGSFVNLLNGGIADGVIVVTPTASTFVNHAPLVVIDPNNANPDLPAVIATNYEGTLAAMDHLIRLGHRRIGHITGILDLRSACQRLQGYRDALAAAGIPVDEALICEGDYDTDTAVLRARELLALPDPPTAIFAANDMTAVGIYQAAKEMGVRIPEDLSVVGFDNLPLTSLLLPPLTTVDQHITELGEYATEMALKLVKGEPLEENLHIIKTEIIVRESCAARCEPSRIPQTSRENRS